MEKLRTCIKILQKRIRREWRRVRPAKRRLIRASVVFLVIGLFGGVLTGKAFSRKEAETKAAVAVNKAENELVQVKKDLDEANRLIADAGILNNEETKERLAEFKDGIPWNMTLVNTMYPMEEGYVPELADIEQGLAVDVRIVEELNAMLSAAREDGICLHVLSAYRSKEKQTQVFNDTVQSWMEQGTDYWTAFQNTCREVALPGTSEHGLGLAVDIVDDSYTDLDEGQADTPAAQWLEEHCTEYGFILRYPKDKESTTGIIYESWHYRYVGKEYAEKIMKSGMTLEEYLGEAY